MRRLKWRSPRAQPDDGPAACAAQLRYRDVFRGDGPALRPGGGEQGLYRALRESLPLVDAAIGKLVRLTGGFELRCGDPAAEAALREALRRIPVGYGQRGIGQFLNAYLGGLLTDGCAIGEMVVRDGHLAGLCWGDVRRVELQMGENPLEMVICQRQGGELVPLPRQHLLLLTTLNPEPENPMGVSLLRGMPALAEILMKIYRTIGVNWERAGNLRYSVVCRPGSGESGGSARERAGQIAEAWSEAMRENQQGVVRDFVAVGDVDIRVIGADGQVMDSEVPVRQLLEQIVARTGLPPFLLGLSWSSTERMSQQQADLLTSELWSLRRTVEPVLERIGELWLALEGYGGRAEVQWDEISLQDTVEEARAGLYRAQTAQMEQNLPGSGQRGGSRA